MYKIDKKQIICNYPEIGTITIEEMTVSDDKNNIYSVKNMEVRKRYVCIRNDTEIIDANWLYCEDFILYENKDGLLREVMHYEKDYCSFNPKDEKCIDKIAEIFDLTILPFRITDIKYEKSIDRSLTEIIDKENFKKDFLISIQTGKVMNISPFFREIGISTLIKAMHKEFDLPIMALNSSCLNRDFENLKNVFLRIDELRGRDIKYILVDSIDYLKIMKIRELGIIPIGITYKTDFI